MVKNSSKAFGPTLIFLAVSLFSFLSFEYLQWRQNNGRSVVFSSLIKKKEAAASRDIYQKLITLVRNKLAPSMRIVEEDLKTGGKIRLESDWEEYEKLAEELKKDLSTLGLRTEVQTLEELETGSLIQWSLRSESSPVASLFFHVSPPIKVRIEPPSEKSKLTAEKRRPREEKVAIIIDDLGYDLDSINVIISLHRPLTVSILPDAPLARETAEMAERYGLEVMLHLPMESINSRGNNGSRLEIRSQMTPEEIYATLKECLSLLPNIKGVNNHMGSLITQQREIMAVILSELKARGLFFIDSRTTDKSIAFRLAEELGLPAGRRDIFLDAEPAASAIQKQLQELIKLCQKKGELIAIGHPFPETLSLLPDALQKIEKAGIKVVPISEIIKAH